MAENAPAARSELVFLFYFIFLIFFPRASGVCSCVLATDNIAAVEMDPLHLEVRPYIQS